jgi:hypothetical protein
MHAALDHPILKQLDAALVHVVPTFDVSLDGAWTSHMRRYHRTKQPPGSNPGLGVDIVDHVWDGRLISPDPLTGMAFLLTQSGLHWAKAAHASQELTVDVSLHAYTERRSKHMTFAARLDDAHLPGVPVATNSAKPDDTVVVTNPVPTGRVACLARCDGNAFLVLLFPSQSIKFGRNRLWRLRDSIARGLPPHISELLTRRRAGVLPC